MYINKTISNMTKYPQIDYILTKIEKYKLRDINNIEIIKDNKVVLLSKKEDFLVADFCIYSDYHNYRKLGKLNKIIYFWSPINYDYVPCKYSFISVNIVVQNDSVYKLQLNNFYIAGNKFNSLVVCYLLHAQHGLSYNSDNIKYVMNIIDQDVSMVSLCDSDELVLQEDTYTINKNKNNDNNNNDNNILIIEPTNIVNESTGTITIDSDDSDGNDYITIRNV